MAADKDEKVKVTVVSWCVEGLAAAAVVLASYIGILMKMATHGTLME